MTRNLWICLVHLPALLFASCESACEGAAPVDAGPLPDAGVVGPAPAYGLFNLYHDEYQPFRAAMGFSLQDYWDFADDHAARLDVRFTRTNVVLIWALVEPTLGGGYDWNNESMTDLTVSATYAPAAGKQMDMLLVFDPARTAGTPVELQQSFPRGHEAEYQTFVRAAVERYDGDGVDDADPQVRVKHWQVMNEPFANLRQGLLTVEEYADLVRLTAQAVRDADPDARIVLGDTQEDVVSIVPLLEGGAWFDAVDVHYYPEGEDYLAPPLVMLRDLLDTNGYSDAEVWMAEMGVYLHAPGARTLPDGTVIPPLPEHSPADQARILVKSLVANRALGARRILVVNLISWANFGGDPQSIFNFMGLISSGTLSGDTAAELGIERIAYYAFQRLIVATETDVADLVGVRGTPADPVRVIEFRRRADGASLFVAWTDEGSAAVDLPWDPAEARVTDLVPDAAGNFTQSTASATNGQLSLTVGGNPLLVEPTE